MRITQMTWVKDFREFAGETSAHGVKNIFEGPSKIAKMLFLLCWIAASIYSCYIIISSIVRYINVPTSTKFEVRVDEADGRPQSIKFPTITICTHNKVKKSYLETNPLIKDYYGYIDMYDQSVLQELLDRFDDPKDNMSSIANKTWEEVILKGGPDPNRMLMCQQRSKNCKDLPDFHDSAVSVMEASPGGVCWRINPDGKLRGKMGDYGKLKLMLWADVQDYPIMKSQTPALGYVVAFHDHTSYGSTMTSGFLMSPGTYYKADLRLKSELREPPPGGSCDPTLVDTIYGAYGEGACINMCKDKHLFETCGCVNVVPPLNNGTYVSCSLKKWAECGLSAYLDWYSNFTDPNRAESFCPCSQSCSEVRYEAQVSSSSVSKPYSDSMWAKDPVKGYLDFVSVPSLDIVYNSSQDIQDNLMVVDVLFTSMQKSEIREIVTYGFANLLGDIGGVLGLFLGASLFTILEFFQFLMLSVNKHCCGGDGEKKLKDEDKDML